MVVAVVVMVVVVEGGPAMRRGWIFEFSSLLDSTAAAARPLLKNLPRL